MNWLPSTVVFALTIYASQCTPLPPAIYNASFSSLSLYSYFDTVSYTDATDQLVTFLSANRFALVNQFVCESYDPVHFAAWSRKVNDATGAQVHVLFDNAVWNASTTCTKECVNADSVPTGWCCGGIDAKLQWAQEVLNNKGPSMVSTLTSSTSRAHKPPSYTKPSGRCTMTSNCRPGLGHPSMSPSGAYSIRSWHRGPSTTSMWRTISTILPRSTKELSAPSRTHTL